MHQTKMSLFSIFLFSVIGCHLGCGGDDAETALVAQNLSDEEVLTKQKLYEPADWEIRWEKSRAARKRYMKLRDTYPDVALNAYIEYRN